MNRINQSPEGMVMGGRYQIVRLIGSGGMANVYLAADLSSGVQVAIKILKPEFMADEEFVQRFDKEAKAASSLHHPNIVRVLAIGQEGAFRYMVQEYIDGVSAKSLIVQNGKIDWKIAVPIAIQVGMALDYAHQNGIVHRDIKPDNILITKDRSAHVTDFGIARAATNNTITLTSGGALGSVHYFSPEQARGSFVGPSSDVYSFGVFLFEMITGRVPFDGDTPVAIAIKHLQEAPPQASNFVMGVPPGLDAIIQKSMQKSPDYRYGTIREMVMELDALMIDPSGTYGLLAVAAGTDNQAKSATLGPDANYNKLKDIENSIEKRRKSRLKDNLLVVLLVAMIVTILISVGFLIFKMIQSNIGETINQDFMVENYIGLHINDVIEDFKTKEFDQYEVEEKENSEVETGIVFAQSIDEGVAIKQNSGLNKLILTVSSGVESITLPDFAGQSKDEVRKFLVDKGLVVKEKGESSDAIELNRVIRTEPMVGSMLEKGDEITIVYSEGLRQVNIPDLEGLSRPQAEKILLANQLVIGQITISGANLNLPAADQIVMYSDPVAGTPVNVNSMINLTVASQADYDAWKNPPPETTAPTVTETTVPPTTKPAVYSLILNKVGQGVVTGGGDFEAGKPITVRADNEFGSNFVFQKWIDSNGSMISNNREYSFAMPDRAISLTAVFVESTPETLPENPVIPAP